MEFQIILENLFFSELPQNGIKTLKLGNVTFTQGKNSIDNSYDIPISRWNLESIGKDATTMLFNKKLVVWNSDKPKPDNIFDSSIPIVF